MCNQKREEEKQKKSDLEMQLRNGKVLKVRLPQEEDALSLINHSKKVETETNFYGRAPDEFSFTLEQGVGFIKNLSGNDNMCFLVGVVDDEIIANVSVGKVRNNRRLLHRATLGITIQKKYWSNGIGKLLMSKAIEWCKDNCVEQLELDVVSINDRAVELYKKFGFEVHGTRKNALKYSDGTYADEYSMILFID